MKWRPFRLCFGRALRQERRLLRIKYSRMSHRLGIAPNTYCQIEVGNRSVGEERIGLLQRALGEIVCPIRFCRLYQTLFSLDTTFLSGGTKAVHHHLDWIEETDIERAALLHGLMPLTYMRAPRSTSEAIRRVEAFGAPETI